MESNSRAATYMLPWLCCRTGYNIKQDNSFFGRMTLKGESAMNLKDKTLIIKLDA
jgi:hypothetical protein